MTLVQFKSTYASLPPREVLAMIEGDAEFRATLEQLYTETFHRKLNRTCSNCWFDAYILLMTTDIQKLIAMSERIFELPAGALLIDVLAHDDKWLTSHRNLDNDRALYHLATNPSYIKFFSKAPEDWKERAAAYAREHNLRSPLLEEEGAEKAHKPAGSGTDEQGDQGGDESADNAPKTPEELKSAAVSASEEALKKAKSNLKGAETRLAKAKTADVVDEEKVVKAQASYDKAVEAVAAAEKTLAEAQAIVVPDPDKPEEKPEGAEGAE